MVLFPDSPFLNDVIALLIILLAFMLVLKLIKNSDRLILTLIGILMGVIIARYFPLFVEQVFSFVEGGWRGRARSPRKTRCGHLRH